jgi:hypothetical protein
VSGTCTDNAGKIVGATSSVFSYDASPPALDVTANPADGIVVLHWAVADIAPLASVRIERAPGRDGKAASLVYRSVGWRYRDVRVKNRLRYRYTLVATDQAGNATTQVVVVTPGPHLLAPDQDALLTAPPALQWTPVRGASYYNVQLYRGGKKILSVWPTHPVLQLEGVWRFRGRRYQLRPGRYRWYVWPGFGARAAAHYGMPIGNLTFVVMRLS